MGREGTGYGQRPATQADDEAGRGMPAGLAEARRGVPSAGAGTVHALGNSEGFRFLTASTKLARRLRLSS
jgi:hypothetical protein